MADFEIRPLTLADLATCLPLLRELRPHVESIGDLTARWQRMVEAGYCLLALFEAGSPLALAGFRVQENFVHGKYLYLDDLVTAEGARSRGIGAAILNEVKAEAARRGCVRLVLDTPLSNVLGHRFYYRNGLLARSLRFAMDIPAKNA